MAKPQMGLDAIPEMQGWASVACTAKSVRFMQRMLDRLRTAEYITDSVGRNACAKLEMLKGTAFIDVVLYGFETNTKKKPITRANRR